ncbi:MAG: Gfo/Idh/MocA family oxidoreductase [Deltaproteobacteria bacterium]|nr:Gfo/Idh/MocA family oxidoreductase [Deltaproteobacteria bacterium]
MSKAIRWGIIGCGDVTEKKSGPAFQLARDSSLVAVMRRRGDLARDYAARHGVARWYDDADKLIHDPEVDAVYIATPPSAHKGYALACARAGKPAYVEKPMALDEHECREMVDAFRAAGTPLFVAYYRRALPRFLRVKQWIDAGRIGRVRFVQIVLHKPASQADRNAGALPWRVVPEISGGGHFVDLACHTLDLLAWMLGPIVEATGIADNQAGLYRAEDVVTASLRFAGGALGTGVWCFAAAEREDRISIVGDQGMIGLSTFGDVPIQLRAGADAIEEAIAHPAHIQLPLVQSIVDELNGSGQCPSTGDTGLQTTRVIDQILAGWRQRLDAGR